MEHGRCEAKREETEETWVSGLCAPEKRGTVHAEREMTERERVVCVRVCMSRRHNAMWGQAWPTWGYSECCGFAGLEP